MEERRFCDGNPVLAGHGPTQLEDFIIDLGDYSGRLAMGFGNGSNFAGIGSYSIAVWQIEEWGEGEWVRE